MTIPQIIQAVAAVAGNYSRASFYRDVADLGIEPLGRAHQKPQQFSHTTPALILSSRGFETALMPLPPLDTAASALATITKAKLPTLAELKRVKRQAKSPRR